MPIINPTIETYKDFAVSDKAKFKDYFNQGILKGDDGKDYFLCISIHSLENRDEAQLIINHKPLWFYTTPKTKVIQRGEKPEINLRISKPFGAMQTEMSDSAVKIKLDEFEFTLTPPNYRFTYNGKDLSVDLEMKSLGTPFWFGQGKEEGARISPSTTVHGIELFGEITGTLVIDGKKIHVSGPGIHEHIIAEHIAWLESVWQDWLWFVFDDLYGLIYEKQGGGYKDGGIYLRKEQEYLVVRDLEIDHPKWAYSPTLQHDWPIKIESNAYTDKGTLHVCGDVVRSQPWHKINKYRRGISVPGADMEVKWSGEFIYNDGTKLTLENGKGGDEIISVFNFTQL